MKTIDVAIELVRALPEDEQEAAASALLDYLKEAKEVRLTPDQIAEVKRRRARLNRELLSIEDVRARLRLTPR